MDSSLKTMDSQFSILWICVQIQWGHKTLRFKWMTVSALQIRAGHQSITANLWPLTAHIYHIMIIVTSGFSKKYSFVIIFRSSCMQMFFKTGVIRNFAIFTGKHPSWSLFLIKLQADLQLYFNLTQKILEHR